MNPLHKEKYILSFDSYAAFNADTSKAKIEKNKRGLKTASYFQIGAGGLFIISMIFTKEKNMFVFTVFAVLLVIYGLYGLLVKVKKYDGQVEQSLKNSYEKAGFKNSFFDVKFYEDCLKYTVSDNTDTLNYTDFAKFYDEEKYFALHFTTGDVIVFNPDCNKEKIKQIILSYVKPQSENN